MHKLFTVSTKQVGFPHPDIRDESFITSWGGGGGYIQGGSEIFLVMHWGGGVENKMTYG